MGGILDMLSAPATGNTGTGFPFAQSQPTQPASPFMALMQGLWGAKAAPSPYGVDDANAFVSSPYAPTQEQVQRQAALANIFPSSKNIIDRRGALESLPQQLPLQQTGQGLYQSLQANPMWPMRGGPMFRF
jgi:hypothetical protein